MRHPTQEELEAVALGQSGDPRAADIEAHVAGCTDCSRELAWLRAEKTLIREGEPLGLAEALAFERRTSPGAGPDLAERLKGFGKR